VSLAGHEIPFNYQLSREQEEEDDEDDDDEDEGD